MSTSSALTYAVFAAAFFLASCTSESSGPEPPADLSAVGLRYLLNPVDVGEAEISGMTIDESGSLWQEPTLNQITFTVARPFGPDTVTVNYWETWCDGIGTCTLNGGHVEIYGINGGDTTFLGQASGDWREPLEVLDVKGASILRLVPVPDTGEDCSWFSWFTKETQQWSYSPQIREISPDERVEMVAFFQCDTGGGGPF